MEIDEVINAIYSGDADDAILRLTAYMAYLDAEPFQDDTIHFDLNRIPVAAQKAKNARTIA